MPMVLSWCWQQLCDRVGKPATLLVDAGYAGEQVIVALEARGIEPLIAISRQEVKLALNLREACFFDAPTGGRITDI